MPELNQRQKDILMRVHAEGEVGVDTLAGRFGVTAQQIRRDLAVLCDQGMAMRTHGGVRMSSVDAEAASLPPRTLRRAPRLSPRCTCAGRECGSVAPACGVALRRARLGSRVFDGALRVCTAVPRRA